MPQKRQIQHSLLNSLKTFLVEKQLYRITVVIH
nr:MAG TPA: hypothetical protein [Caudoviricetes sp.]